MQWGTKHASGPEGVGVTPGCSHHRLWGWFQGLSSVGRPGALRSFVGHGAGSWFRHLGLLPRIICKGWDDLCIASTILAPTACSEGQEARG